MSSGSRPLSSLNLPKSALSALTRAGFETVRDLFSSSAESLAKDIRLPIQLTQQIITASQQKAPGASFAYSQTVSASVSAGINAKFSTGSKALDVLLGGGMARGQVLEISGPPGSPKTELVLSLVSGFLQSSAVEEEGVLLVGKRNRPIQYPCISKITRNRRLSGYDQSCQVRHIPPRYLSSKSDANAHSITNTPLRERPFTTEIPLSHLPPNRSNPPFSFTLCHPLSSPPSVISLTILPTPHSNGLDILPTAIYQCSEAL